MAFRFGIPLSELALCQTGPLQGYVSTACPLASRVRQEAWDLPASELGWALLARDTEHHAMVLLAGSLAEAKLMGTKLRAHCCESDLQECQILCGVLAAYRNHVVETQGTSIPEVDPIKLANRLREQTRRILGHPVTWRAVTALARDLESWRWLTGHDAADTVQWTRRIHNQLTLLLPMPRPRVASARQPGQREAHARARRRPRRGPIARLGYWRACPTMYSTAAMISASERSTRPPLGGMKPAVP